ncbi:MAG: RDD family protein [Terriglobia bacterium]
MSSLGTPGIPALENEDWRDQLSLKLEQIKLKPPEPEKAAPKELVEALRSREFIRPGHRREDESTSTTTEAKKAGFHPLAEKTLLKLDRVQRGAVTVTVAEPPGVPPSNPGPETLPAPPKKPLSQAHGRKPDRIERIEIALNQRTLPFDSFEQDAASLPEEAIRNGIRAADISERLRAGLIDGMFVTGCFLFFLLVVLFVPEFKLLTKPSMAALALVWVVFFVGYHFLFTALGGRTLGMEYERLHVVNFEGHPISVEESRLRTLGYLISLGCFGLGYLWSVFDPDRLTWHDKISKTLVVERREFPMVSPELPTFKGFDPTHGK